MIAHEVFVSYATEDKRVADAVCAAIEARGFRCWMAPRDVTPGMPYGEAIINAIQGCSVMVVVFSSHANASVHVAKEVERAVSRGVAIIPLRIEDVLPAKTLDYFLGSLHWLDALTPPLDLHLQKLTDAIAKTLDQPPAKIGGVIVDPPQTKNVREPGGAKARPWWRGRAAMVVAAVVLLAVLAGAGCYYRSRVGGGETIDSLAVLPFVNGSGDPNMEYLGDGISESLINSLSQLPNLRVMSRDSAFHYKGKDVDAETIGNALGVRAVFKGQVTQVGDNLEISAELIDARDNSHIWGDQYDRKATDIFALQADIAKEIAMALRTRLIGDDQKRLAKNYTANPEAYQDYLKGRYWLNKRTEEGENKGLEYFQQAIATDPSYALAYDGIADCYTALASSGLVPPKDGFPKAKEAALKALEIDDTLAEAHASLAYIKAGYDWDWSGAEKELQQAIALSPSYAEAHRQYGNTLRDTGRLAEAITEHKRAVELDPLSLIINRALGVTFYEARQYDQAIVQEQKTLELDPNFLQAHDMLGNAYLQKSMYKEGIAEFEKMLAISPDNPLGLSDLGYAYAVTGRRAEAQKALDQLNQLSKQEYVSPVYIAKVYAGLGDKNHAFESLQKAYEDRSIGVLAGIKAAPAWDPLRSDPRYADLLRRMNLQP